MENAKTKKSESTPPPAAFRERGPLARCARRLAEHFPQFLRVALIFSAMMFAGCTFARYSKLRVQVIDNKTSVGIQGARLRVFYITPMFDTTYRRKDREKTDGRGFANMKIATNWSQRSIFGWTYGIIPAIAVDADGYVPKEVGISGDFSPTNVLLIPMDKAEIPKSERR
jgi:hypothetical protein